MPIHFFTEDISFNLPEKRKFKSWLTQIIQQHQFNLGELNYIFCSDKYLLKVNQDYLQHDYYTDIITFDQAEEEGIISGDLYISIDRLRDHAKERNITFAEELKRVMVHGVLHLIGFGDKTPEEAKKMRTLEEESMRSWI